jgi:hypothetical protein
MTYPPQQPGPYGPQDPYGQQPYGQQPYGQPQWGQPAYPVGPPPKKSRTGLIVALVIVAVLVVGGGGVTAFLLLKNDEGGGAADGGDGPRATADQFVMELGKQLSMELQNVDLKALRSLTCGDDFGKLSDELADARESSASDTKSPERVSVMFTISDFKETSDGAAFTMTPRRDGEDEDPMSMTVLKENENWVVCGLYGSGEEREAPGSAPSSGGSGASSPNGSIPNPIPKTS